MLNRRWFIASLLALLVPVSACADEAASYREGEHYLKIDSPVRTSNPDKIEVTEVFWYGCSHCFHFEPLAHAWAKQQPDDVVFVQSPAMWNAIMKTHAQAFYTAKALGVLDKLHQPIFNAINLERNMLRDENALAEFFSGHGVEEDKFRKVFNSFSVNNQVRQADARARGYGISGTPEMIVNGKYRVTTRTAGGQRNMLKVVDYLVEQERKAAR